MAVLSLVAETMPVLTSAAAGPFVEGSSAILIRGFGIGTCQDLVRLDGKVAAELRLLFGSQLELVENFALCVDALNLASNFAELNPTLRIGVSDKALIGTLSAHWNSYPIVGGRI